MNSINAQIFGGEDSKWIFNYSARLGITHVFYEQDTLIGERSCKKFRKQSLSVSPFISPDTIQFELEPMFIHEQEGIVEFSLDKVHFDTLHNFYAPIGTSWRLYFNHNSSSPSWLDLSIVDTFRTPINNRMVFSQAVAYKESFPPYKIFVDTTYAMIGNKWSYILPWDYQNRALDGGEGGLLICFENEYLGAVSLLEAFFDDSFNDFGYECSSTLTGTQNIDDLPKSFICYPNPAHDYLQLEFSQATTIQVYQSTANRVGVFFFEKGSHQIDIGDWERGIYWAVNDKGKVEKFIIF